MHVPQGSRYSVALYVCSVDNIAVLSNARRMFRGYIALITVSLRMFHGYSTQCGETELNVCIKASVVLKVLCYFSIGVSRWSRFERKLLNKWLKSHIDFVRNENKDLYTYWDCI